MVLWPSIVKLFFPRLYGFVFVLALVSFFMEMLQSQTLYPQTVTFKGKREMVPVGFSFFFLFTDERKNTF